MARKVGIVKKLTKTLKHMTKPKNLKKVLLLLGVLLALYMIRKHVLKGVEGFESSVGDFDKDVSGSDKKLVMFYADWCPHCKTLKPKWEKAASEMNTEKSVKMISINAGNGTEEEKALMSKYSVEGYPTILVFENGEKKEEYKGERETKAFKMFFQ